MELFVFDPTSTPKTRLGNAQLVQNTTSKTWIERYREAGEFSITAPVSSNLRKDLPLGSFVSHFDTHEVMIVENHEISETSEAEADIVVTGRSLETLLEQRIVGSNRVWPMASGAVLPEYVLAAAHTWVQAKALIAGHIQPENLVDASDQYEFIKVNHTVTLVAGAIAEERTIEKGDLYERVQEILAVDDLGLKIMRPGAWSPYPLDVAAVLIHTGVDVTDKVAFSYAAGDIVDAQYLWSNKGLKTSAFVIGKWLERVVHGPQTRYDRRVMYVDAKDIDDAYEVTPTGAARTSVLEKMAVRGRQALAAQKMVAISGARIASNSNSYVYRKDYNIGDIVAVDGNYDSSATMRVVEYVEIEDENGESGYPTLSGI